MRTTPKHRQRYGNMLFTVIDIHITGACITHIFSLYLLKGTCIQCIHVRRNENIVPKAKYEILFLLMVRKLN